MDDTTWNGTVTEIDTSPQQNNGGGMYYGESDEQSNSSKYAFYVEPESLDGFMLGQHILIDTDSGSDVEKTGIWLYEDFIQKDGEKSFVWAKKSDKDVIEKRYITIGQTDEDYGDCEITDGLSTDDYIAYPADYIKAGLTTTTNSSDKDIPENDIGGMDDEGGMMMEDEGMMEEGMGEEDMGGENDFVMNDDGSYSMTDENGNTVEVRTDGSGVITSPDGGVVSEVFHHPAHPYTIGLKRSKPVVGQKVKELYNIPGSVPNPVAMPDYCYFRDRCEMCVDGCSGKYPPEISLSATHRVSCYRFAAREEETGNAD